MFLTSLLLLCKIIPLATAIMSKCICPFSLRRSPYSYLLGSSCPKISTLLTTRVQGTYQKISYGSLVLTPPPSPRLGGGRHPGGGVAVAGAARGRQQTAWVCGGLGATAESRWVPETTGTGWAEGPSGDTCWMDGRTGARRRTVMDNTGDLIENKNDKLVSHSSSLSITYYVSNIIPQEPS